MVYVVIKSRYLGLFSDHIVPAILFQYKQGSVLALSASL